MIKRNLVKELNRKNLYLQQIEQLHTKLELQHRINRAKQDEISFYHFVLHAQDLSKHLVQSIKKQDYHYQAVQSKELYVDGKLRIIYPSSLTDRIVQSAIYQTLAKDLDKYIPLQVYSYIKGRSPQKAIQNFANFLRGQLKFSPKKHQNMFVLQTDIHTYTDCIPLAPNKPVWKILKEYIYKINNNQPLPDYYWYLLESALRPKVISDEGNLYQLLFGLPMGSSLTTIIAVLYLEVIDKKLSEVQDGFYARYGDDLLFAHPDPKIIIQMHQNIVQELLVLGLKLKAEKTRFIYLTKAGKTSEISHFIGNSVVEYLGFSITAHGEVGFNKKNIRKLWQGLKKRVNFTNNLLKELPLEKRGRILCQTLAEALDIDNALAEPNLKQLLREATSRSQFRQIDYQLALYIAERLSGIQGVKAFRKIPYKKIRKDWQLPSLCILKNKR